jgi:1-acyl-sn-glycerol-3-phosphate acyltransferase
MEALYIWWFKSRGWRIIGEIDTDLKKAMIAVAPHWKSEDFFVGLASRALLKRRISFLGKAELFKPPFGFIFRALGGIPVDRSRKGNLVEQQVYTIKSLNEALISLAPEGTRKDVGRLRSGFYYIAVGAEMPIIRVGFDYDRKEVVIAEPFYPTGDFKKDMMTYFVPFFERIGGPQKSWIARYREGIFDH